MFNPDHKFPRRWKEMALDLQLLFAYHACMMVLFIAGPVVKLHFQIGVVGLLVVVLCVVLAAHRVELGWRWARAGVKNVLGAVVILVLGIFFLGAATPLVSPLDPRFFPWFAGGGGIVLFGALESLRVVYLSKQEFLRHCRGGEQEEPGPSAPTGPRWKKVVRTAFSIYFLAAWIAGVGFFWKFSRAFKDGAAAPTSQRTEPLTSHGTTVYITPEEKRIVSLLQTAMMVGIPSALALAVLLHFVVGVKLFPGPSLWEMRKKG